MSELISGKEALIALANGEDVQYISAGMSDSGFWSDSEKTKNFTIHDFYSGSWAFRLKPKTITINNIEVPAPFEPKEGDRFFYLNDGEEVGYIVCTHDWGFDPSELNFGAWRTEDEIKQVVSALRKIFVINNQ